jgi:hypothetical protein
MDGTLVNSTAVVDGVWTWARDNDYSVSDRGRISREVLDAYEEAQQEPVAELVETVAPRERAPGKRVAAAKS